MTAGAEADALLNIGGVRPLLGIGLLKSGKIDKLFRLYRLAGAGMVSHGRLNRNDDECRCAFAQYIHLGLDCQARSVARSSARVLRSAHVKERGVTMPNITLLHSPTCGACPSAKRLWKELRVKYSFSYREVDITTPDGQELANRHSVRAVPATMIDGRLTFVGVPPRQSAEKALQLKMKPQGA